MGTLKHSHKLFCELYVSESNASKAYKLTYPNTNQQSAKVSSCRLLKRDDIIEYISSISNNTLKNKKAIDDDKTKRNNGNVYLIKCVSTSYYKIGKTVNNPETRLRYLQTSTPFDLEVVHFINADNHNNVELLLHNMYCLNRVRGEWFEFSDEEIESVVLCMTKLNRKLVIN